MKKLEIIQKRLSKLISKRDEYLKLAQEDMEEDADFYYRKVCSISPRIQELKLILEILEE